MAEVAGVRALAAPSPFAGVARVSVRRLSTDNPFYVLSALLVFVGLKVSFGAQVRAEQTWALMFGLAGYTILLAVPSCLLVRVGGVWEDVRTVLLLVVLMFLATSVTIDETLSRDPALGVTCSLAALAFAVAVSEGLLRGVRLNLPAWFRVPYYLALGLFFLYPVALLPLLDRPRSEALEWALFGFSPAAGLVALSLLPAARRGPGYVAENGSPWRWPLFPWVLFGLLGLGAGARSFLLCWSMQHVEIAETEQVIFGPYFLVPFGLAVAILLLEIGRTAGSRSTVRAALVVPAVLAALATVGHRPDDLYQGFLRLFVERLGGTPFYLALVSAAIFYAYAAARRTPGALGSFTATLGALALVGPGTLDLHGLVAPRVGPVLMIAVVELGLGGRRRESWRCLVGSLGLVVTAVMIAPDSVDRGALAFHLGLLAVLAVGAVFRDSLAQALRAVGALLVLLGSVAALSGRFDDAAAGAVPLWVLKVYPLMTACLIAAYGWRLRHAPSLAVAALLLVAEAVVLCGRGYRTVQGHVVGLDYIVLGLVLLAVAQAISAAKAGLLSRWTGGGKDSAPGPWL